MGPEKVREKPVMGPETSHGERAHQRMQVVYARKTHERQVFMQELKAIRRQREKRVLRNLNKAIGPTWYHALSVPQRSALDGLEFAIYQDILEGRPIRTAKIMRELGIFPRPNVIDLMNCVYLGRKDPKELLAQLFHMTYDHPIEVKRFSYCLNAKLMLSAILYLGLNNIIKALRERFRPEPIVKIEKPKRKPKLEPPLASPYLQIMKACLAKRPKPKPFQPAPLPNLDDLNELDEDPKPPIHEGPKKLPPPPPPAKKRLSRAFCDKLAGVCRIEPHSSVTALTVKTTTRSVQRHKGRASRMCVTEVKKTYGMSMSKPKKPRRKKLQAPNTGIWNAQYMICGVYSVHGKTVFVLGNVTILQPVGDLIHGGFRLLRGEYINIHCGIRGLPPPPKPDPCDCVTKWQDPVFEYIKRTKCFCKHFYDYGNEGEFQPDELPFFQKPTKSRPYTFNYQNIYNLDPKQLHVEKEFKKIWDTDSVLHDDANATDKKEKRKRRVRRSSTNCLGTNPKPQDYLKCALRLMRNANIAARLPDIHLVPELKEWMRNRIYGPLTLAQKAEYLRKSSNSWEALATLANKGFGHVSPPKDPKFSGHTNWVHKQSLNDHFRKFTSKYRLELYRSYAKVNNILWPTMYQAQFPDKKFREIFFSYLFARVEDLMLIHPYSVGESAQRHLLLTLNRYCCPPAGIENINL